MLRFPRYWMSGSANRAFIYFEICMLRTRHDNIAACHKNPAKGLAVKLRVGTVQNQYNHSKWF